MSTIDDLETQILGKPIEVNPGNTVALVGMVLRYIGSAGGFLVAVIGAIGRRDMAALFDALQADTVLPALGAIATLGFMAWGAFRLVLNKKALVTAAKAAPDSVAVVVAKPGAV